MKTEKELKLEIANMVINTICPEKSMEEIYALQELTPYKHINKVTGHEYTGLNRFALELSYLLNNFEQPEWATFNQFKQQDKQIIKGSKATKICVAVYNKKKNEETEQEEKFNFFKGGSVFNLAQVK